jgi:TctA family transporter
MKPHFINLVNAIILVVIGFWAYVEKSAPTALIPVFLGGLLWLQTPKMREGDSKAAHIAVVLTFLGVLGLFMPLRRQMANDDAMGTIRTLMMLCSGVFALYVFIQSFMDARKARAAE